MENYMLRETLSYPDLLNAVYEPLMEQAKKVLSELPLESIDSIYIYGSGDSMNAAVCAAQAFAEYAKLQAHPIPALQASRYLAPTMTPERAAHTLTICISNSGEAARSVEASMALRAANCHTMAITANPDSRVGKAVEYVMLAKAPAFPPSPMPIPGIRSFAMPVMGIYHMALLMGLQRGVMSEADVQAAQAVLAEQAEILRQAFASGGETLKEFGKLCGECERMEFMGAGPCRGACDFGVSKVLEGQGYSVLSQDIEEYAHQTFFSNDTTRLPTVLLVPSAGRCLSRAMEILFVLKCQKRPVLVLTDDAALLDGQEDVCSVCLGKQVPETMIPLVFACLMTYLASVIPLREGDIYMHGHLGVYAEEGLPTVRGSKVEVVK